MTEPLIIKNWQDGIGESASVGFAMIRNADIESFPGAVKSQIKPQTMFHTSTSSTFTADASTDILTCASNISNITTTTCVQVSTTGTLPTPLAASTNYFAINLSSTQLQVATSISNANLGNYINITDAGSGVHTVATLQPGTINYMVTDPRTGTTFAHDSNGRVWFNDAGRYKILNGNTLTNSAGNGLALSSFSSTTSTWLFVFRNATVDVVDVFGTTLLNAPVWTSGWLSLNSGAGSGNPHYAISGQDNVIYFVDDRYVGSIRENSGSTFDPSNAATYTATNNSLDLPVREVGQWLEELGVNLLIAGGSFNFIYPWDRSSSSYNLPIPVPENGVKRLKNIGNVVYILAGTKGNIYTTQGSYVKPLRKLPFDTVNAGGTIQSNPITWGGIAQRSGALIFGVTAVTGSNSGVYLLYPDGRLVIDAQPSTGAAIATAIYAASDFYTFGYAGGIDDFNSSSRQTSYGTVLQSALYRVATKMEKANYNTLEVQLTKPATGGHIRVSYRTNLSESFTVIDTYTTDATTTSFETDCGIIDIENIQVQVEMDGNMDLAEVRLLQ